MNAESTRKPDVAFTTERFYMDHVDRHGLALLKRHVNRYKWATSNIPQGARVIDAGCGSGYGDHILRTRASEVLAIDVSEEAINYAKWKAAEIGDKGIMYVRDDLQDFPVPHVQFDAAVCIEVIEHVGEKAQEEILHRLAASLTDAGVLMITTPIKQGEEKLTEFHEHEFSTEEFKAFLGRRFYSVAFDDAKKFGIPEHFMLAVCRGPRR